MEYVAAELAAAANVPVTATVSRNHSKLDREKVALIRKLRFEDNWPQARLASEFGVTQQCISAILVRKAWKDVA
jgi:hypothetical protein